MCCRRFNDRLVRIIYCEEEKFEKKHFEDNEESNNIKTIIIKKNINFNIFFTTSFIILQFES